MSRYSRCPYVQNASSSGPAAATGSSYAQPPPQQQQQQHTQHLRNPWVAGDRGAGESQSTNSSSSSRTYRGPGGGGGGGPGPPVWHAPPPPPLEHYNHHPPRPSHYLIDHQAEVLDGLSATHHLLGPPGGVGVGGGVGGGGGGVVVGARGGPLPLPHTHPHPYAASSSRAASDRDRPLTPASSPGGVSGSHPGGGSGGSAAAVDGCGGHCVAFENFCYRCLQVIFIAGILTGVSLTIAGSVMRHAPPPPSPPSRPASPFDPFDGGGGLDEDGAGGRPRGGDLTVLVYIGCMLGLVCALLLAVQCCVRRNVKRRKRALRASAAAAGRGRTGTLTHAHAHAHGAAALLHAQQVPLGAGHGGDIPLQDLQYQPLLMRLVQQQQANAAAAAASSSSSGNQRLPPAASAGHAAPAPAPAHHYHRPAPAHAHAAYRDDLEELEASCSGVPWWRRGDHRQHARPPHVAETRR